jgi:tetratricopeptide (TPR) repeat protein
LNFFRGELKGLTAVSTQSNQPKRRFLRPDIHTFLLLMAIGLAAAALFMALRDNVVSSAKPRVDVSNGVDTAEAEAILARANDAAAFVGNLLSFLEATFAVITLGLAVGAWIVRAMILDQAEEAREFIQRTEEQIRVRGEHLDQLEKTLTEDLRRILQQTQDDISGVKQEGRDSFRVLRLQLLAEQQVRSHNIDTAIDTLMTAHQLDPDDHATNYLLGYLFTTRKEIEKALGYLEHALALEPDFTPGSAALGLALRRKGDSMTDPAQAEERNRYWAQAEAELQLGGLYRRQHRYYAALDAYELAHKVTPDSSYPITNLALIHAHQGNKREAEYYFTQVIKQAALQLDDDPRDAWTRCDLALARLVLGEPDEGLHQLETVIEQEPERGVLETVYDGLLFLREAPEPIRGLDALVTPIEEALRQRDASAEGREGPADQDRTS